jgi:peroxiredoxin
MTSETSASGAPLANPLANPLAERLAATRETYRALEGFFDEIVLGLKTTGVGGAAPGVGEIFPEFALPSARGGYLGLGDLLAQGPVVLNFSRGRWCPYCVHELAAWGEALPALNANGARFLEVTGETGGEARSILHSLPGNADVVCDVDHGLALSLGLAFFAGEPMLDYYREAGLDMNAIYGSNSGFLPVPATYVVGQDGAVRYAFVDVDFRNRAEPADVLAALEAA